MIKSFANKKLENFFYDGETKGLNPQHVEKIERILTRLHAAISLQDMRYPGSGLHRLEPRQESRWAVKVSGNWRITFRFIKGHAYEVDYVDYH
jgi:proteic killer suppression protein